MPDPTDPLTYPKRRLKEWLSKNSHFQSLFAPGDEAATAARIFLAPHMADATDPAFVHLSRPFAVLLNWEGEALAAAGGEGYDWNVTGVLLLYISVIPDSSLSREEAFLSFEAWFAELWVQLCQHSGRKATEAGRASQVAFNHIWINQRCQEASFEQGRLDPFYDGEFGLRWSGGIG